MTMDPKNVSDVETVDLTSTGTTDAEWVGGFFAYGGSGAENSVVISFAAPAGKRLGRHTDTAEETQFILAGAGDLVLDDETKPLRSGDVVVLAEGTFHDLHNTGTEDLHVIAFFSAPKVEQHWSTETWGEDNQTVTGSPN